MKYLSTIIIIQEFLFFCGLGSIFNGFSVIAVDCGNYVSFL